MTSETVLKTLLERVARGEVSVETATRELQEQLVTGYVELLHTKVDVHRQHRRGVPEVIYGAGKSPEQILASVRRLDEAGQVVLCTRVTPEAAKYVTSRHPGLIYDEVARVLAKPRPDSSSHGLIAVLSAGTSDQPVAEEAAVCAQIMGNKVERVYDVGVAGLHRLMNAASSILRQARAIIVVAGMEGALPSVVAGLVAAPVIAVPTSIGYGASFGGIAALLGMLNSCAGGVAVVNIDNGFGAALIAHFINHTESAEPAAPERSSE